MWLLLAPLALAAPHGTVQIDPLTVLLGFPHVQVELVLAPSFSIYVGPHLRLFSAPWSEPEPYIGIGGEVGLRWYPFGRAPEGWWLLGRGVLAHLIARGGDTSVGGYGSALAGYTHVFGEWFVLSGGAGAQRFAYTVGDYGVEGWAPALHTAVGVAF